MFGRCQRVIGGELEVLTACNTFARIRGLGRICLTPCMTMCVAIIGRVFSRRLVGDSAGRCSDLIAGGAQLRRIEEQLRYWISIKFLRRDVVSNIDLAPI